MRLGRCCKKLALVLVLAAGANALVVAAPAHVSATTPVWTVSSHSHLDCCPPVPQCESSCAVMSHCALTVAVLPSGFQQAVAARPRAERLIFQSLLPTCDALSVEAPPPRL
jgi:hypothetical protein